LDGCVARRNALLGSRACFGGAAGRLVADGTGYWASYAPRLAWVGILARFEANVRVTTGLRVAVGMDGILPLVVPKLEVRSPQGTVMASVALPQFGVMFFAGPEVDF
jgi:hypothetical protein